MLAKKGPKKSGKNILGFAFSPKRAQKGGKESLKKEKKGPETKKVIFRGTCYFVGASTKTEVRGRRKSVRNPEKNGDGTTSETEARSGSDFA